MEKMCKKVVEVKRLNYRVMAVVVDLKKNVQTLFCKYAQ